MNPRLAARRKAHSHPRSRSLSKHGVRVTSCIAGRPEVWFRGVRTSRGCARGSDRLQKLTGGVWPVAPTSEELAENDVGSSPSARELGEAKQRRKPNRRWQNRDIGGGFPPIGMHPKGRMPREHSVDGSRSEPGKPQALTRVRSKRFWLLAKPGQPGGAGRDMERQRPVVSLHCGRERRGEVAPPSGGARCLASEGARCRARLGRSWSTRRQARPSRGQIVARRSGATVHTTRHGFGHDERRVSGQ